MMVKSAHIYETERDYLLGVLAREDPDRPAAASSLAADGLLSGPGASERPGRF
jgi:hypothetical protein